MSDSSAEIVIRTGPDPRERSEFAQIRDEINKISHPAQPEVNWRLIESQALTLFRTTGVDLQTVVYYTLARSHLQGLPGFTAGCELLAAMIVHQWDQLWPKLPQARTEILEWFTARVGSVVRQHPFTQTDLPMLYRAERALQLISDKLQQVELPRVPRVENLLYLVQNTRKRLAPVSANTTASADTSKKITLVYLAESEPEPVQAPVDQNEPPPEVEINTVLPPVKRGPARFPALWGFIAGVAFCLLLAAVVRVIWIEPQHQALAALADTPEGAALLWLRHPVLATYGEQLRRLDAISPVAGQRLADRLVNVARTRWPASEQQQAETRRRMQLLQSRVATDTDENSYQQVQQQLQALSDELLARENARTGLTISYLKTVVYQMQKTLSHDVPLEELMRQYAQAVDSRQPVSPMLAKQTEERFNILLERYHQLTVAQTATR